MSTAKIRAHIRLENGQLISKANAARFVVHGRNDVSKTILGHGFTPEYRERWVIKHEPQGYIWREVTHGMGINGHRKTLRDLVMSVAVMGYEIEVLEPEPAAKAKTGGAA
jgi:hypothetical protein